VDEINRLENERLDAIEAEKERIAKELEEKLNSKKAEKQAAIQALKDKGEYLTKKQLIAKKQAEERRKAMGLDDVAPSTGEGEDQPKSLIVKKKKNKNKEEKKIEESKAD
jgi:hypothetical protein